MKILEQTATKLQGLIAKKTKQAEEEIAIKSNERKNIAIQNNKRREAQKKRAMDTTEATEAQLQEETSQLIQNLQSAAELDEVSDFAKSILDVLNNYQVAINTIRSMSKNMYDGLFFLTNDVKSLEQTQTVIITKLDRLDSKVK